MDQQIENNVAQGFIFALWSAIQGTCILQAGVKTQMITGQNLAEVVHAVLPTMMVALNDQNYAITSIASWQRIITDDWTSRKKYMADTFDCDNFSDCFRAHAAELYNLNSAGMFHCSVSINGGTPIGHRAVVICALDENDNPAIYCYESENEAYVKVVLGQPIKNTVFGETWAYTPLDSEWN